MDIQIIEKLVEELKTAFSAYTEKKSFGARTNVRKVLQQVKVAAQEMRKWILSDFK